MTNIKIKCKNCGNETTFDPTNKLLTCKFCGYTFLLTEMLDINDIKLLKKCNPYEVEKKIMENEYLKRGDELLFKAEYKKAEENFKKVIEINNKNFKAFYGVVKAKTHNFNYLPPNDDYKVFVKRAVDLADFEDKVYIKNQFSKLDILEEENRRIAKINEEKKLKEEENRRKKSAKTNLFSKVLYFCIFAVVAVALLWIVFANLPKSEYSPEAAATIEINGNEDLKKLQNNKNILSSTIILLSDIDLSGESWIPIGSNDNPFVGKFYGNGHTISNLNLKVYENVGFFGVCEDAIISSLKFKNIKIDAEYSNNNLNAGIVVGYAKATNIRFIEVFENCSLQIKNKGCSNVALGGIVGKFEDSFIGNSCSRLSIDCYDTQNVKIKDLNLAAGGIAGFGLNSEISHCYSTTNLNISFSSATSGEIYASGIIGLAEQIYGKNYNINNSIFSGSISVYGSNLSNHLAGIVCCDDSSKVTKNYVLLLENNFELDNNPITVNELADGKFQDSHIKPVKSEADLKLELSKVLDSNYWTDLGTSTPHLI